MHSSKSRTRVSRRPASHQRSKTAHSQFPYGTPVFSQRGGGADQLPCGSSRSRAGGRRASRDSYSPTGSVAGSTTVRIPAYASGLRSAIRRAPREAAGQDGRPARSTRRALWPGRPPSRLMPMRMPCRARTSSRSSVSRVALVWTVACTVPEAGTRSRTRSVKRASVSAPASRGSPPCRTRESALSPWARACSPMRNAVRSRTPGGAAAGRVRQVWSGPSYR